MGTIKRFEDLECWKRARLLVKIVYTHSRTGRLSRDFGTRDQLCRATLSIMNNIAEGFARPSTKEFIRFLSIAESSASEVKSMCYVLEDLEYLEGPDIQQLHEEIDTTRKMIKSFIAYLNKYKAEQASK